jgi:hypothetical protein
LPVQFDGLRKLAIAAHHGVGSVARSVGLSPVYRAGPMHRVPAGLFDPRGRGDILKGPSAHVGE